MTVGCRSERGFTLMEMAIVIMMGGIVTAGVLGWWRMTHDTMAIDADVRRFEQQLDTTQLAMHRDARDAATLTVDETAGTITFGGVDGVEVRWHCAPREQLCDVTRVRGDIATIYVEGATEWVIADEGEQLRIEAAALWRGQSIRRAVRSIERVHLPGELR